MPADDEGSPRERYLTVFGRRAVREALDDPSLPVAQVFVARDVAKSDARALEAAAAARGIPLRRVPRDRVTRLSGSGRQHQGVAADVETPNRRALGAWLAEAGTAAAACVLLDGVTTPANVGMIIRSAVAAGLDAVVVPTHGVADLGPLVIKASAGLAFRAPLVRVRTATDAADALSGAGFDLIELCAGGEEDLWSAPLHRRTALVVGGEHAGVSDAVRARVSRAVRIPMAEGVESLNVAVAASMAFFEVRRRAPR